MSHDDSELIEQQKLSRYYASKRSGGQDADEVTPEEVAEHERAQMLDAIRKLPKTDLGAIICSEALGEELSLYEAAELAELLRVGLSADGIGEFDDAAIGRVCRGALLRHIRGCAGLDR